MRPKTPLLAVGCALSFLLLVAAPVAAQPKKEKLATNPGLFLKAARTLLRWDEPAEPAKIVGPIHFVGTRGLGSFLITGSEGHVLVYTGMPGSGKMIEKSIAKLGFDPKDVKIILTGHAHCDHAGGHAHITKATGARIAMMREEVELFESGGRLDFHYGDYKEFAFEPAKVDTVLRDEDEVQLGDISIQALLTPGHTKGSTTYVTKVVADGKTYTVVFPDGTGVNPGYRVARNPSYQGIEDNYRRTFRTLEGLKPDVWLACHNEFYGLDAKLARAAKDGAAAWVDPEGYKKYVAAAKAKFEATAEKEIAAPAGDGKHVPVEVAQGYSTCRSWQEVVEGENLRYAPVIRVSDPGTKDRPAYTGFWFYDGLQFDESGRYALAMKVSVQERDVTPSDRGEIGYIDLKDNNKWTKVGETTAWNWQQGCRLTWRGRSHEILWNDRADDGSHFVCRAYDFKTGARRTLPRPIYDVSRDGASALTHDFQRMRHGKSTNYVGVPDRYEGQIAPAEIGIEKMDMNSGRVEVLISLKRMAEIAFPQGYQGETNLYFFREGWNPSGTRFIAFLKNADRPTYTGGWSISADGKDVRFFYTIPSHHAWLDDDTILEGRHFTIYKDDGSGKPHRVADVGSVDFDPTVLPGGQWFLLDTYPIEGYQHVVLFHRPSRLFVPLAKLKNTAQVMTDYRVDIHARTSRDGRTVCIDATHEGLGRQMYIIPIGHILDHPPRVEGGGR